jgi:hypothetical protein
MPISENTYMMVNITFIISKPLGMIAIVACSSMVCVWVVAVRGDGEHMIHIYTYIFDLDNKST